ncbi:MAG: flavoprotein [Thermoanaerobaculales bacterium]|jgi:phosphopantothenoylcysteine decarboxylase/phosphopantothenate--cysteine ligase|nr:flavoprotein [Thermoanaerobaculales bacterium]
MSKSRILLQVTGSIAAFKAASLASMFIDAGHDVQCVLSDGGRRFVGEATFEGLTHRQVVGDIFEPGHAHDHIRLAEWADLMLLYPASANHITRLRSGLADDLIGCLFLANNFRTPYWIAPAMNSHMLAHPAVREALSTLGSWGCRILPTGSGRLACGEAGDGRLIEADEVFELVVEAMR